MLASWHSRRAAAHMKALNSFGFWFTADNSTEPGDGDVFQAERQSNRGEHRQAFIRLATARASCRHPRDGLWRHLGLPGIIHYGSRARESYSGWRLLWSKLEEA